MPDEVLSDQDWLALKRSLDSRRFFGTLEVSVQAGQVQSVKETQTFKVRDLKERVGSR